MKESDLYDPIKTRLETYGFKIYPEVQIYSGGNRADIAGYNGKYTLICELKKNLSWDVIEQAIQWTYYANIMYIGVKKIKKYRPAFIYDLLRQYKIGLIEVGLKYNSNDMYTTNVLVGAQFNRNTRASDKLLKALVGRPEWDIKGGMAGGGYMTTYSLSIERVREYLISVGGGASMKDIIKNVATHWANPASSLSHSLQNYETEEFEIFKVKNRNWLKLRCSEFKKPGMTSSITQKELDLKIGLR